MSLASLLYYPQALRSYYLTTPTLLLLAIGGLLLAVTTLLRRVRGQPLASHGRWTPVLLAPLSGWLVLLAITNKDVRYVLPMVSVLAVVSVAPLGLARGRLAAVVVACVGLLSYGLVWSNLFRLAPPSTIDWQVEPTAELLANAMRDHGGPLEVLVVPNDEHMNFMALDYAIERLLRAKVTVDRVQPGLDRAALARYGAVVTVEPPVEETALSRGSIAATSLIGGARGWREIAVLPRGDGRTVHVRVRRGIAP